MIDSLQVFSQLLERWPFFRVDTPALRHQLVNIVDRLLLLGLPELGHRTPQPLIVIIILPVLVFQLALIQHITSVHCTEIICM